MIIFFGTVISGAKERNISFDLVKSALRTKFSDVSKRASVRILIPGAGLARLGWDLVHEGFSVVCYEFSYQMLLVSNFMLNHTFQVLFFSGF